MLLKRFLTPVLMATLLVVLPAATAALASDSKSDVFNGIATTGVGRPMPVDVDPTHITVRADGAVGLAYSYKATGRATGDVPGSFEYQEHGYLFFRNPADPTTFAGSRYDGGSFTVHPTHAPDGKSITITDTDPAAYEAVVRRATLPALDQLLSSYGADVITRLDLLPVAGSVSYGAFTFTDNSGTFWGVSTPDSRQFLMKLKWDSRHDDDGSIRHASSKGADFNSNVRFSHGESDDR